jgi:hypothetical protein
MSGRGRKKFFAAICPACGDAITLRKAPRRGNLVTCRQCESLLKVAQAVPLRLEWAFEDPLDETYYNTRGKQTGENGYNVDDYDDQYDDDFDEWDDKWLDN